MLLCCVSMTSCVFDVVCFWCCVFIVLHCYGVVLALFVFAVVCFWCCVYMVLCFVVSCVYGIVNFWCCVLWCFCPWCYVFMILCIDGVVCKGVVC